MKKLPKEIYVQWEGVDEAEPFLMVYKNPKEVADFDGAVTVGKYVLKELVTVKTRIEIDVRKTK